MSWKGSVQTFAAQSRNDCYADPADIGIEEPIDRLWLVRSPLEVNPALGKLVDESRALLQAISRMLLAACCRCANAEKRRVCKSA